MSLIDCHEFKYCCYTKWYSKVLHLIFLLYLMKQFSLIVCLQMKISKTQCMYFGTRLEPGALVSKIPAIFLNFCHSTFLDVGVVRVGCCFHSPKAEPFFSIPPLAFYVWKRGSIFLQV